MDGGSPVMTVHEEIAASFAETAKKEREKLEEAIKNQETEEEEKLAVFLITSTASKKWTEW